MCDNNFFLASIALGSLQSTLELRNSPEPLLRRLCEPGLTGNSSICIPWLGPRDDRPINAAAETLSLNPRSNHVPQLMPVMKLREQSPALHNPDAALCPLGNWSVNSGCAQFPLCNLTFADAKQHPLAEFMVNASVQLTQMSPRSAACILYCSRSSGPAQALSPTRQPSTTHGCSKPCTEYNLRISTTIDITPMQQICSTLQKND